ncbi:hypothetical protein ACI3KT_06190 [Microbacterium sp. ZW T6_19]|uniref:hypothetical protein n=1 Tax=Microbacterium sp. ZW T6_19 TaxID=3378082 RepID=UPI003854041B
MTTNDDGHWQYLPKDLKAREAELDAARVASAGSRKDMLDIAARGVGTALVAMAMRSSRRRDRAESSPELLPEFAWRVSQQIGVADVVLHRLGASWTHPATDDIQDYWLFLLREGLDAYAQASWHLRFGYPFAAAAIVRNQIERWTFNIASSIEAAHQAPGEPFDTYIERIWAQYGIPDSGLKAAIYWRSLSAQLHGRSTTIAGASVLPSLDMPHQAYLRLAGMIVRAAEIPLRQVRGAIDTAAEGEADYDRIHAYLQAPPRAFPPAGSRETPDFLHVFSQPLLYDFVMSDDAATYSEWGATYRRITAHRAGEELTGKGFIDHWMPIEERWARAIDIARFSFEDEARIYGEEFDSRKLDVRVGRYRLVAEIADLSSELVDTVEHRHALRTAAAAVMSAVMLWLQDSNQSMMCARSILEMTARSRAHRCKPRLAQHAEERGNTAIARWLRTAGWGRLRSFARALGEFSHTVRSTRLAGAFDLLQKIQMNAREGYELETARGAALDLTINLLMAELQATLDGLGSDLAAVLRTMARDFGIDTSRDLETWLQRAHEFADHDFGEPLLQESTSPA